MTPFVPRRMELNTTAKQQTFPNAREIQTQSPTHPPPPQRERSTKSTQKLMIDAACALD
eukprot:CAMPEP_0194357670 /NCGR_PEP_ID=MMETSP0174-20130528/5121_1 /TAXON_ID=216777 /ORGANISM="Proboscia alata, Strain PI-D3" /LENGTH=58 /DNA_ID=CAMNT_0039127787 /DNA_START=436 /DNA_END=612 /DNA_ORIENTATION=+